MKLGLQHSAMLFVAPTSWAATAQRPIARGVKALARGTAENLRFWLLGPAPARNVLEVDI